MHNKNSKPQAKFHKRTRSDCNNLVMPTVFTSQKAIETSDATSKHQQPFAQK